MSSETKFVNPKQFLMAIWAERFKPQATCSFRACKHTKGISIDLKLLHDGVAKKWHSDTSAAMLLSTMPNKIMERAVVAVKWSASTPSTPKILVQIPLATESFCTVLRKDKKLRSGFCMIVKNANYHKEHPTLPRDQNQTPDPPSKR